MASRRIWITATGAGVLTFAAVQLIRPAISHPPVTADLAAPPEIKQIPRNSYYDCHSNETRLAWFDEIVPVYWLVAHDVQRGRSKLNFSEIGRLPATQQKAALYEAVNQIQFGAMPLPAYTRLHRTALISAAQLSLLKSYLNPTTAAAMATEAAWRPRATWPRMTQSTRNGFTQTVQIVPWKRRSMASNSRTITRIGKQSVRRTVSTIRQCA